MKNFFKKIAAFFVNIWGFLKRVWDWPKVENAAKELLRLAAFFGLISAETRDRLLHGIDAGEDLVLDGIAKFENIVLSVEELIGALKMLLSEVFPKQENPRAAPRGFKVVAAAGDEDDTLPLWIVGQRERAGNVYEAAFSGRRRGLNTEEFIQLCQALKERSTSG